MEKAKFKLQVLKLEKNYSGAKRNLLGSFNRFYANAEDAYRALMEIAKFHQYGNWCYYAEKNGFDYEAVIIDVETKTRWFKEAK